MKTIFSKIENIIKDSELKFEEQYNFLGALACLDDMHMKEILDVFESDPAMVAYLYTNFMEKKNMLEHNDLVQLSGMINEEAEFLKQVSK